MGFNKGKGATKEGRVNHKRRFIVDPLLRMQLMVPPDLTDCKVRACVYCNIVCAL
jgi:hypothetical protein